MGEVFAVEEPASGRRELGSLAQVAPPLSVDGTNIERCDDGNLTAQIGEMLSKVQTSAAGVDDSVDVGTGNGEQ